MLKCLFMILILFPLFSKCFSTTLIPIPIQEQLKNSNGVIIAKYKSKTYKKIRGTVVTEASFIVRESVGVGPNKIINKNHFKIVYPGGIWQGQNFQTIGGPSFSQDEEVVLILKETTYGLTIKGQSLGKYSIIRKGPEIFISSNAFPNHSSLGKIKLTKFKLEVEKYYGDELKGFHLGNAINEKVASVSTYKEVNGKRRVYGRKPSSVIIKDDDTEASASNGLFWPAILLAVFGSFWTLYSKRHMRKK